MKNPHKSLEFRVLIKELKHDKSLFNNLGTNL